MPLTSGGGVPDGCELYLDGARVPGGLKPCNEPVLYPALIEFDGTYRFSYTLTNAAGETAQSPASTQTIETQEPPADPTEPPNAVVT